MKSINNIKIKNILFLFFILCNIDLFAKNVYIKTCDNFEFTNPFENNENYIKTDLYTYRLKDKDIFYTYQHGLESSSLYEDDTCLRPDNLFHICNYYDEDTTTLEHYAKYDPNYREPRFSTAYSFKDVSDIKFTSVDKKFSDDICYTYVKDLKISACSTYPLKNGEKVRCSKYSNVCNPTSAYSSILVIDCETYNQLDLEERPTEELDSFNVLDEVLTNLSYGDRFDLVCRRKNLGYYDYKIGVKQYNSLKVLKEQNKFNKKNLFDLLAFSGNSLLSILKPSNLGKVAGVACEIPCSRGKVRILDNKIGANSFCSLDKISNFNEKLLKTNKVVDEKYILNYDFSKLKRNVEEVENILSKEVKDYEKLEKQAYLSNKETDLNELYNLKKYDEKYSKLRDRIIDDKNYNPINNLFNNKKDGELISVPKKENNPKFNEEYANFLENNKLMDTDLEYEIIKNLDRTNTKDDFLNNLDLNFMSGTRRYTQPEAISVNRFHYGSYSSKPNTNTNTETNTNTNTETSTNTETNTNTSTNTNTDTETNTHTNTNTNTNTETNTHTNTNTNTNTHTNTNTNTSTNINTENKNDISNKVETSTETNVSTNTKTDNKVDVNVDVKVKVDDINVKLDDNVTFDDNLQIKNNDYLNKLIEEKNNFLNSIPIDEYMNVFSDMFNSIKELLDLVKTLKIKKIENYSFVSSCSQSYSLKITENYIVDGDYDICKTVEPAYPILHTIFKLVFLVLSLFSIYKLSILVFR